jgi:hypothetical protein
MQAATRPQSQGDDDFSFVLRNDSDNNAGNETDSNVLIMDEEAANLEAASALDEEEAVLEGPRRSLREKGQGTELCHASS